jgi:hypothetical protein
MSMDGTKEIKTLEIRSIPHLWQSPGPISGIFFVDDGPGLLPTIMVFSYWDSDDEAFRSTFIQLVAPMFPEHEWWGAAVAAAGGRTSENMKSRCGVIVVESLTDGHITLMNLTDTVPLPSEMPMSGKDCGAWVECCPYMVHRQDRTRKGETILHMLCGLKDTDPLKSYLDSVGKIAPIIDDQGRTPLDVAMYNNDYVKSRLLLKGYIEWSTTGLLALKLPLKQLAEQYPNLITEYLKKSTKQIDCKYKRMSINRPLVSHGNTLLPPWTGNEKTGNSELRQVDASVIGFSGFMDSDGPYEAIVEYGELSAFDTDSFKRVIQFKWQAYGYPIYNVLAIIHVFITSLFSLGNITVAFFPTWSAVQVTSKHGAGTIWLVAHAVVIILVLPFLFFEGRECSREGFCAYSKDPSNYLEILNSLGVISPIPYYYLTNSQLPDIVVSFLILTTWLRVLTYLRAYQLTGGLMRMVTAILLKMRVFMLILAILGIGYMAAFSVLFPNLLLFRGARLRILVTFFEALLGDPVMTKLLADPISPEKELNMTSDEYLKQEGEWTENPFFLKVAFGQILLILFYLLVVIVMLNLLIAIMGNAFDEIAQNEAVEMQRARAQAILYIERNILSGFMENWEQFFPRYLHVVRPHEGGHNVEVDHQSTAEGRIENHFNQKMKIMEEQMLTMSKRLDSQMLDMMTLLGAGVLIERSDHPHKLRHVQYKNWTRTIPLWRCATCSNDYSAHDKAIADLEPPVFVCDDYYHALMMNGDKEQTWEPPLGCDFAICAKCIRNQEPLPSPELEERKRERMLKDRAIEEAERRALEETVKDEQDIDSVVGGGGEISAEDMFAMLETSDDTLGGETKSGGDTSMDDMYALLND